MAGFRNDVTGADNAIEANAVDGRGVVAKSVSNYGMRAHGEKSAGSSLFRRAPMHCRRTASVTLQGSWLYRASRAPRASGARSRGSPCSAHSAARAAARARRGERRLRARARRRRAVCAVSAPPWLGVSRAISEEACIRARCSRSTCRSPRRRRSR